MDLGKEEFKYHCPLIIIIMWVSKLLLFTNVTGGIAFFFKNSLDDFMDILPYLYLKVALVQSSGDFSVVNDTSAW